eukprot:GEMP01011757.1.p1 GENE.GEMP01011757.1~~GEMP01011757.1.p1  ORF type:complete len:519 (+),score=66.89 GEMP01011757.1:68-1624(+)
MLLSMVPFLFGLFTIVQSVNCQNSAVGDACTACAGREGADCSASNGSGFGTCHDGECLNLSHDSKTPQNASETNSERRGLTWNEGSVPRHLRRRLSERNGRIHFNDCWNRHGEGRVLTIKIGFLVDNPYWRRYGGDKIDAHLRNVVAHANRVYADQMDIVFVAKKTLFALYDLRSSDFANAPWLYDNPDRKNSGACLHGGKARGIDWRLKKLTAWANSRPVENQDVAFWMLFTGCSYNNGQFDTLGLAHLDGICRKSSRHGVVATASGLSLGAKDETAAHTFTHEVGHLLGARHSMKDHEKWQSHIAKEGTSLYGIMDYSKPYTWAGIYQFHPVHMENICRELNAATLSRDIYREFSQCFSNSDCPQSCSAKIGDGICEEECNIEACNFDGADCAICPGCFESMLGDGKCDDACNMAACNFDNQDCSCSTDPDVLAKCAKDIECWLDCGSKIGDRVTRYVPLAARKQLPRWLANNVGYFLGGLLLYLAISAISACCCCCRRKPNSPSHRPLLAQADYL